MKKVSVVIPVFNEEKDVDKCILSLNKQSYKNLEIIVVDDGSNDNTVAELKKYRKIKLLKQHHKGPGVARNFGARKATGEILVFVDIDMTFDKDYIKNLVMPISTNKKVLGTTHDFEVVENQSNIWSRCWGRIRISKEMAQDVKIFRAIRKKKFLELGGFDGKYGYADDQTLWYKYKIRPTVAENTTCYHKNPETLKSVFYQSRWIGASIENRTLNIKASRYLVPALLALISPLAIFVLSFRKAFSNKDPSIIFPWMFIFMTCRYWGTFFGIVRKLYLDMNVR